MKARNETLTNKINKLTPNMDLDLEDRNICYECVGEKFLRTEVERFGEIAECSYCGNNDIECYTMPHLADRIDQAFSEHYDRMSENIPDDWPLEMIKELGSEWEPSGEPVIYAIQEAADIIEHAASDTQQILEEKHYSRSSAEIGETSDYHSESFYERNTPDDIEWYEKWQEFEVSLKTRARFFSKEGSNHLFSVFKDLDQLMTHDHKPILRPIGTGSDLEEIYRARVFQSGTELEKALANCTVELGPPPSALATAGRMNANGISIFYGASGTKTALAEVRPPVGSNVLVGKFKIIRELKVLDLSALTNTSIRGSIFDKNYAPLLRKSAFLARLSQQMTRAVMPNDERFEYLPTQVIADFLGSEIGLDGIIFPSVQSDDGYNIALFHHASRVIQAESDQETHTDVSVYEWEDGQQVQSYSIDVSITGRNKQVDDDDDDWLLSTEQRFAGSDPRIATLKLINESLTVEYIKSVEINNVPYPVAYTKRKTPSGTAAKSAMRKGLKLDDW
jgi:hypothetical protein